MHKLHNGFPETQSDPESVHKSTKLPQHTNNYSCPSFGESWRCSSSESL